ncbi:predicted protein [Thalassiosira pseudonana CCMP1335]|uniref:Uncharacterized protein n=1 Tax=Thalassiosira pseudonana TaxID=35128 RepID=B8LDT1_THAPS|nr:predicted protein [Thalassiosira pseudonana CCMP1335]EED86536.1 predicted protein [Thalassiosira pseudonana CCMP1335]
MPTPIERDAPKPSDSPQDSSSKSPTKPSLLPVNPAPPNDTDSPTSVSPSLQPSSSPTAIGALPTTKRPSSSAPSPSNTLTSPPVGKSSVSSDPPTPPKAPPVPSQTVPVCLEPTNNASTKNLDSSFRSYRLFGKSDKTTRVFQYQSKTLKNDPFSDDCLANSGRYRTCFRRATNLSSCDAFARAKPFLSSDETMASDTMHLTLIQDTIIATCRNLIQVEKALLTFLADNIGSDTSDSSGRVLEQIRLCVALKMQSTMRLANTVQTLLVTSLGVGVDDALDAILAIYQENLAKVPSLRSTTLENQGSPVRQAVGKGLFSTKPVQVNTCSWYGLLNRDDFNTVIRRYSEFKSEMTRAILDATDTEAVAKCCANRFSIDKYGTPSLTCDEYDNEDCPNNEDIKGSTTLVGLKPNNGL